MRKLLLSLFVFSLCTTAAFAGKGKNDDLPAKKVYNTKKINPHPPTIDGVIDDEVWKKVEWGGDFIQREPFENKPPSQPTSFKILYDDNNLYIAIRAHDAEPEKIEKRVTRRDGFAGDWVEINIDSYFDHRTAFSFTITAAGVKGDEAITNDGNNWDENWDPIWYGAVSHDDQGWSAEMRIPFSQLRFGKKEEHVWGIQFTRRFYREDERSVWQFVPRKAPGWVSYFGELRGIKGVRPARRLEVLPYTVADLNRFEPEVGNPFADGSNTRFSGGLDAKLGVTSDLTLDVTVNPDFGQVEADPSEVNLSAFETFFQEKRPFFIEGQNILDFGLMLGDGPNANDKLFYSRRIGRQPQYRPSLGDGEYLNQPDNTSIASALKLTGKTKNGLSIGILDAMTQKENAVIDFAGSRRNETVEPFTNYFLGRIQKDYGQGNTSIGGMMTATNRNISEDHLGFLNKSAYTGGFDVRHQWSNKTYSVNFKTAFSKINGTQEAMLAAQTSSARYYQRPDADYVSLDSSRTSLAGHGGYFSLNRSGNSRLQLNAGVMWRSPGLELNDLGFMRQADRVMQWSWAGYRITEPFSIFRNVRVNFNQWAGWNFGGDMQFAGGNVNGGGQLKNHWFVWLGLGREGRNLSTSALRGGPAMKFPGQWNQWYNVSTDNRKSLSFHFGGFNSWQDFGDARSHNVRLSVSYRPSNAMSISLRPSYNIRKSDLQYIQTSTFNSDSRYLFGRIDQKTLALTIRLNYSVTPTFSIQYYGQPFVSAGDYTNFKRITNPQSEVYADRFHQFADSEIGFDGNEGAYQIDENQDGVTDYSIYQPNFNFRQFRSNLIARWEYIPGSTIFLVWTQSRTGSSSIGEFSFSNDLEELFDVHPNNIFLIKVSRWFSL